MNERIEDADEQIEKYFKARPIALNLALALTANPSGMTMAQLAKELNVPTERIHRLTREMQQLGLLTVKGSGKEQVFQIVSSLSDRIFELSPEIWRTPRNDSVERQLFAAKTLVDELRVPLSPKHMRDMLRRMVKRRVRELLPAGLRQKRIQLRFVFGEPPSFDLVLGDDKVTIGVELKILDSPRNIREAVGGVASLASYDTGLDAIVPVFLLLPVSVRSIDSWPVDSEEILEILRPLSHDVLRIYPIVEMVELSDLVDSSFTESLAKAIVDKLEKTMEAPDV